MQKVQIIPVSSLSAAAVRLGAFVLWQDEETFPRGSYSSNRGPNLRPDRLVDLMDLVAADYVEGDHYLYKLTSKGGPF